MRPALTVAVGSLLLASAAAVPAQTLKGSRVAMQRQHEVARAEEYTFLRNAAQIRKFVSAGLLLPVAGLLATDRATSLLWQEPLDVLRTMGAR